MSRKPRMGRITEPDENEVHYVGPPIIGNVTLCGLTDFIYHKEQGEETDKEVTCKGCIDTLRFVYAHQVEPIA